MPHLPHFGPFGILKGMINNYLFVGIYIVLFLLARILFSTLSEVKKTGKKLTYPKLLIENCPGNFLRVYQLEILFGC